LGLRDREGRSRCVVGAEGLEVAGGLEAVDQVFVEFGFLGGGGAFVGLIDLGLNTLLPRLVTGL